MDMGGTLSITIPFGSAAHVARRPVLCLGTCFVTERMSGYVARPA